MTRSLLPNHPHEWAWFWRGSFCATAVITTIWLVSRAFIR